MFISSYELLRLLIHKLKGELKASKYILTKITFEHFMVVENISPFRPVISATCGSKSKKGFSMSLARCVADVEKTA